MIISLIFGLLLGAMTVVFALQNIVVIPVTFFVWTVQGSLSIVLLTAVMMGVLICILFTLPEVIRNYVRFTSLRDQNAELKKELQVHKDKVVEIENKIKQTDGNMLV